MLAQPESPAPSRSSANETRLGENGWRWDKKANIGPS
jgi:hypothetical protein